LNMYNRQREGWRWAEHYWSRGHKVKTRAFDAQENATGLLRKDDNGSAFSCARAMRRLDGSRIHDASCGCGPKRRLLPTQRSASELFGEPARRISCAPPSRASRSRSDGANDELEHGEALLPCPHGGDADEKTPAVYRPHARSLRRRERRS